MDAVADTTFLVGLWRRQSWATGYAASHPSISLGIPWVVLGEFWHGALKAGHPAAMVSEFLTLGQPLMNPEPVVYARICAELQDRPVYREIGQNDLWIAAAALAENKPLLTRNRRHFGEIPNLRCEVLEGNATR